MTRILVIGHGMVGARFAEELVAADPEAAVIVLGKEPTPAYNRVLLSGVVAGTTGPGVLDLAGPEHPRLHVLTGVWAESIDREGKVVHDSTGRAHHYDRLVLATGSVARVPAIQGVATATGLLDGVFVLKDLADASAIVEHAGRARNAVVLGAGVLGIEVATGLARRGLKVQMAHLAPRVMNRQLGWDASEVAQSSLARLGITTHVDASLVAVRARRRRLSAVRFTDGSHVAADLLVLCAGTNPETGLAQQMGLTCDRGVLVDEQLRTSDPDIFAIGDCAQPPDGASGLVAQGWEQARTLVRHLTRSAGDSHPVELEAAGQTFPATSDVVRVKASGLPMVSMGLSGDFDRSDPRFRVLTLKDRDGGRFVELVLQENRLLGATCVGDAEVGSTLSALYTRAMPLPADPAQLMVRALDTGAGPGVATIAPADLADADAVCLCNSVPAGRIRSAVRDGCCSVDEVAAATRAGTGCGDCRSTVAELLRTIEPDPPMVEPAETLAASTDAINNDLARTT